MKWVTKFYGSWKGYTKDEAEYELAVVRTDNAHGLKSMGWGGDDKIILFDSMNQPTYDKKFALKVAQILCDGLNKL
jgi:hypothetical protein